MAFDGILMHKLVNELSNNLVGGRIDKIHQPEKDELSIHIRSGGINHILFISIESSMPYLTLIKDKKENPQAPPMFCMLMRKHLISGKVLKVAQQGFERVIQIDIETHSELGDIETKQLVIEIMGKHSNVILLKNDTTIIDCIKRVSYDMSRVRPVQPGLKYLPLESQKLSFVNGFPKTFDPTLAEVPLSKSLVMIFEGFSPQLAKYVLRKACIAYDVIPNDMKEHEIACLNDALQHLQNNLDSTLSEGFIFNTTGKTLELTFLNDFFVEPAKSTYTTLIQAIDAYYGEHNKKLKVHQKTQELKKNLSQRVERLSNKKIKMINELDAAERSDEHRIKGELILAHLHLISKGDNSVVVTNYYNDPPSQEEIDLDVRLEPSENANTFFKKYTKAKNAIKTLQQQIDEAQEEVNYLEQVLVHLQNSEDDKTIAEIRYELMQVGFLKKRNEKKVKVQNKPNYLTYKSSSGIPILVGKNNIQNDFLTTKLASNKDLWFHTKDIPGSHVIVRLEGKTPDDQTMLEAAAIAAYHSKARESSNVPVDYTFVKNVTKPSHSKPGMVIYVSQKTLYVTPEWDKIKSFLSNK